MNTKVREPLFSSTMDDTENLASDSGPVDRSERETSAEPLADDEAPVPVMQRIGRDRRRRRRFEMKASVRVLQWNKSYAEPDIASLEDANAGGILFTTEQDYPLGAELLVKFPYPGYNSPQQKGHVVRVKMLPDGRRRVAVTLK